MPGGSAARARVARCYLFERLSGLPASAAPITPDDNLFRTKVADFPQHLTPELAAGLHQHAHAFLADQHVDDEPAAWQPSIDLLDHMHLPGHDPRTVDISSLHRLIRVKKRSLGEAAARLGTTLDVVRYVLETHPAPAPEPASDHEARARGLAYCSAKAELPRETFVRLYQGQRISLRDIAARAGVSRQTVTRLARDYNIALRAPRQARHTINRDWLYNQYVTKRRALPDIAREYGMSTANMARWAKSHGIPMRSRGRPSHSANLAADIAAEHAPAILRPALVGIGGWERLQRLADAARHPTLTIAAKALRVHQFALVAQINRLERELGDKLLVRAERGRPMELTPLGSQVVGTIRACSRRGWPS